MGGLRGPSPGGFSTRPLEPRLGNGGNGGKGGLEERETGGEWKNDTRYRTKKAREGEKKDGWREVGCWLRDEELSV